jgi:positive phototaxis protein PixI
MKGATLTPTKTQGKSIGEPFLRFKLDDRTTAVIPMNETQEAISLAAAKISPIPNLPTAILGLIDRRSRLLWLTDLAEILGLKPLDRHRYSYDVISIESSGNSLAIAVEKIEGTMRFPSSEIRSPIGNFNPGFTPFLRGWILEDKQVILVLDPRSIINSRSLISG